MAPLPSLVVRIAVTLVAAEGALILSNTATITILFKSADQRTGGESKRVSRGLMREYLVAAIIFVPVSAAMGTVILRPIIARYLQQDVLLLDSVVGFVSYGFPYAVIKTWAMRAAAKFLKEAAMVADRAVLADSESVEKTDVARL